jgi:5-oxoprolinase (ATP-hydrolysing)
MGPKEKAEPKRHSVYFAPPMGRVEDTLVYLLGNLDVGDLVEGPAMVIDETQTIVVIPGAKALVTNQGLYIKIEG